MLYSAKESQVSKYLKQQEKLRKNFINKNARTANIESTPSASRVIQKYRKLSKKIPLRTETVQSNKIKTVDSLLSDEVPLNYNESSGSEYVPSDNESNPSELGKFILLADSAFLSSNEYFSVTLLYFRDR